MPIKRFFLINPFDETKSKNLIKDLQKIDESIRQLKTEKCFHVEFSEGRLLSKQDELKLRWILKNTQECDNLTEVSQLPSNANLIEIGPRFNFSTADSSNAVSICHSIHLNAITRIETSIRYLIEKEDNKALSADVEEAILNLLSDKMTQCRYTAENIPLNSFNERLPKEKESWFYVPVLKEGRKALQEVNSKMGLAFDNWDLDYYTDLFTNVLKRDPTSVELFDCAQSNSEHSRHWFFKGRMIIDGEEEEKSLIKMIIDTQKYSNPNNTIKFSDNSSAIKGFRCKTLEPSTFIEPGKMNVGEVDLDLIFTAETHNMPTTVASFAGATTGTGGRIRDIQGVGRGGHTIAGTAGYCVGVLNIPNHPLPFEMKNLKYPPSFASPLKIIIEASNGASDYGNKFGEPLLTGFAISYGCMNAQGERDEYVKSIMFSGGLGTMNSNQTNKIDPQKGMLLAKIGGPVYRIGVGGGAASSVEIQGDNSCELDFNAVQRGDAEMENKLNRIVRACIEMGEKNPILAIHDQGAGGNGNVLKELVEPGHAGAIIFSKEFQLGDPTINALELWGAEYQENNAILCKAESREFLEALCERERCPINFVGIVSGNGYVTLLEETANAKFMDRDNIPKDVPFDMDLKYVLGDMPRKVYDLETKKKRMEALKFPDDDNHFQNYLDRVLNILSVGSKRFLTNKVDRCVTGLIVQQQCVGPLHTPLADYALTLVSHFETTGIATSIGTQPIKGLINADAGARMSIAEALSNLVFVKISELADVKCSGNWMWAAKLPGEGAKLVATCKAMCEMMKELNIAVDGGKDSLSMAARVESETVKSPGTLVISTYAPCPDVRVRITPDLKAPSKGQIGQLIWVNIEGQFRLGASALAQAFMQQGNDCPDVNNFGALKRAFNITQKLLSENSLLAGHDISDGGLIVCLLEMAISGMCGVAVDLKNAMSFFNLAENSIENVLKILFAEECGWLLECNEENLNYVLNEFKAANVNALHIGQSTGFGMSSKIQVKAGEFMLIDISTLDATLKWEKTSYELEKLQMNPECAEEEYRGFKERKGPKYLLTFNPDDAMQLLTSPTSPWRVAVVREEGVNGDREMIAALMKAKFEVYDVTMSDLLARKTFLDNYRGVIFPGGFSYADTLGSAKGWAASIRFSELLKPQFENFKNRKDTFSLGVCNGCQLMSMIGWIDNSEEPDDGVPQIALLHNRSGRFECRWSSLKIAKSEAMMLRRMQGSVLGCWVAHGEGRFSFKNQTILKNIKASNCIAMHYVDDDMQATEKYPMNPNGSVEGIAAICSKDGRHLALMPHPERCVEMFQWPYIPPNFETNSCPWQSMFNEANFWCCENSK